MLLPSADAPWQAAAMDRRRFLALAAGALATPVALRAGDAAASQQHAARRMPGSATRRAVPVPRASLVTRWDTDQWSRGSYSALPPGTSPSVRRTLADAILGRRIALAGEYASTQYPSTTTGAYLSGRHAAARLLDRVNARTAIVIGAGMAGATAAHDLRAAGVRVTVLEARDRVGGRIHSDDAWGVPVELGAAWIHGTTGNPIVPLARDAGLGLVPTDYEDAVARDTVTGRESAEADGRWARLGTLLGQLEDAWPPVGMSVETWLEAHGWTTSRLDSWAAQVEITQEYALDPARLGVRATEEGATYRGGDVMVTGGYATIPAELLAGSDLRLSTPADSVSSDGSRVTVTLASGETLRADIAVVAVPLALLRAGVPRVAPLTKPVRSAIAKLRTGVFEKVVLRYDEQWWGDYRTYGIVGGGVPGAPAGSLASLRWTEFYTLTDVLGFPALVGFSGGSAGRSRPASDSACVQEATAALAAAFAH